MSSEQTQVLVIGGGPGGSTTATLLARSGVDVILVERETFPRYHIGESLLPSCLRIFDLMGVREKVEAHGFLRKDGGYFDWGGQKWEIDFGVGARPLYGFQVIRSELDKLMLDHARSEGVKIREGIEVKALIFEHDRPVAAKYIDKAGAPQQIRFDTLVDASGRAGLMATRYLQNRQFHEAFRNVAVWGYWRNAQRLQVGPSGAIATCSVPFGWVWGIPLHDGTLSVGVVMHTSKLKELRQYFTVEEIYRNAIDLSDVISELVEGGELAVPLRTETDYSYAAERFAGSGYYLVGDAACFLDPLLSTGVHLATFSGMVAAASIASVACGEAGEAEAAEFYNASYRRAYMRMLVVVSAFYQTHQGRDSYFRQAQRLTAHDYSDTELVRAFLNIVSGVEDLKDLQETDGERLLQVLTRLYEDHYSFVKNRDQWNVLPLEEINRGVARMRVVSAVQEEFALTEETAIHGLYVVTEPKLLLRRTARSEATLAAARGMGI